MFLKTEAAGQKWAAMIWRVMSATGNGYRKHSLRNTGKGTDRRNDKLEGSAKLFRQYKARYGR